MSSFKELVKIIRENDRKRVPHFTSGMIAGHYCRVISPLCSAWFIQRGIVPNVITLFMIIFGIIGSILFAIPNLFCKIGGYIFYYLWFTMDLSDGEVAHVTKTFSKYGTEIDYMAHLIDHPCMNLALFFTFYQIYPDYLFLLAIVFIIFISVEMYVRNSIAFDHYHSIINGDKQIGNQKILLIKYFVSQALLYPNFILIFTPLVIIDYIFHVNIIYLLLIYCTFLFSIIFRSTLKRLYRYAFKQEK